MRLTEQQVEEIVESTPAMPDSARIEMKIRISIILMALNQPNNEILTDEWLNLWCTNTFGAKYKFEDIAAHFKHIELIVRALVINCLMACTDELMNHQNHMWFKIMFPLNKVNCTAKSFWKSYYQTLWLVKNSAIGIDFIDVKNIVLDKTGLFENNINHDEVWEMIDEWIVDCQITEQLKQVAAEVLQLGEVKISVFLIVFLYELTTDLHSRNLASQIREVIEKTATSEKAKFYSRLWNLDPCVLTWIRKSYCNRNGLIYRLIFTAWDKEKQQVDGWFANGITSSMDPKIQLQKLHPQKVGQQSILYNMSFMIMKYFTFRNLLHRMQPSLEPKRLSFF